MQESLSSGSRVDALLRASEHDDALLRASELDINEYVLLSAESIRSYKTVEWFGASQIMQYQETDEFASLEYSCVLIPVHDA
jgi:hypothetical protein